MQAPSPSVQAGAVVGHAAPAPACAVVCTHVRPAAPSHADVQALHDPAQSTAAASTVMEALGSVYHLRALFALTTTPDAVTVPAELGSVTVKAFAPEKLHTAAPQLAAECPTASTPGQALVAAPHVDSAPPSAHWLREPAPAPDTLRRNPAKPAEVSVMRTVRSSPGAPLVTASPAAL
jgi:hypothetical protein